MDLIIGKRGTGKTMSLILMAEEKDLYILCSSRARAQSIFKTSEEMRAVGIIKHRIRFPVTANEVKLENLYGISKFEYLIDDLDDFINALTGCHIRCATLTPEFITVLDVKDSE